MFKENYFENAISFYELSNSDNLYYYLQGFADKYVYDFLRSLNLTFKDLCNKYVNNLSNLVEILQEEIINVLRKINRINDIDQLEYLKDFRNKYPNQFPNQKSC